MAERVCAERVCGKCGQKLPPEAKTEGRIVELAKAAGWGGSTRTQRIFHAIQAELDSLRTLFRNHEERLADKETSAKRASWFRKRIDKLNARIDKLEDRKEAKPLPCPTDKNGHKLIPGRSVVIHASDMVGIFRGVRYSEDGLGGDCRVDWKIGSFTGLCTTLRRKLTWLFDLDFDERGDC